MVISLKHKKNVSIADDPAAAAAGQVVSSNWNDEHDLTMATARMVGRVTAGTGVAEELTAAQVRTLINVTDAADPTAATINAAASKTAPADADVFGYLDSAASFGLKKFTWANLKTALNALYQPLAAKLTALAGQTWAADQITYQTGASTVGTTALTSFARTLLDDTNQATAQATLGLVIGTNVQAYDADLQAIAALTPTNGYVITGNGTTWTAAPASGGSMVKSFQTGYVSSASLTTGTGEEAKYIDVTVSPVSVANCIIKFEGAASNSASNAVIYSGAAIVTARLTSTTNLRTSSARASDTGITGRWTILELN